MKPYRTIFSRSCRFSAQPGVMLQQFGFFRTEFSVPDGVVFGAHLIAILFGVSGSVLKNGPLDQLRVPMDALVADKLAVARIAVECQQIVNRQLQGFRPQETIRQAEMNFP